MKRFFYSAAAIFSILLLLSSDAFAKKEKFVESDEYKEKKAPTGFIKNYEGMIEGKDIKWVYLKEGVKFGKYDSVKVESFGSIANKSNKDIQKDIRRDFDVSFERIGKKASDSGKLIIKGAMYKVEEYDVGKKIGTSFIPFAGGIVSRTQGNPTVGVEIILIDAATKEEIARIRHEAQDSSLSSAAAEVADDVANFVRDNK